MRLLKNTWYVAAYPEELGQDLLGRKIAGENILMFRCEDGSLAAISNLCPHRFAPLDRGVRIGDTVQCPYHGLEFGADGRCKHNPHVERITANMHVRAFPIVERDGFVWVWPGEAPPDLDKIPDMHEFGPREGARTTHRYFFANYRYDVLIDNLLDLSHADYLHKQSLSSGAGEKEDVEVFQDGDKVTVQRTQWRAPRPPLVDLPVDKVDLRMTINWNPSQAIKFYAGAVPAGEPFGALDTFTFFHVGTPADESHTHYFLGVLLIGPPDPEADRRVAEGQMRVIMEQDGPMLEALTAAMDGRDLMEMKPVILPVDAGAVRARTVMKRLFEAEAVARVAAE